MGPQVDFQAVWDELAALIESLPAEQQARYRGAIQMLVHDLRQNIGIIYSAETLLRRSIAEEPDQLELLDTIRSANRRTMALILEIAHPFESSSALPFRLS